MSRFLVYLHFGMCSDDMSRGKHIYLDLGIGVALAVLLRWLEVLSEVFLKKQRVDIFWFCVFVARCL